MMENNESTRQTTAENKVERLEKEIEALRNRLKQSRNNSHNTHSNVAMKESEKIRFQLSEQVKDLKVQLKYQQTEYSRLQESSNRKTGIMSTHHQSSVTYSIVYHR
ncbi:hypothetical protein BDB01DRAFT_44254 [Pilobolus umbonatus]|nr:hypothetical protein BDB01DRAFT_44254 [Pilobolus umbonatus]